MDVKKENDLLEETLSLAETDYAQAYRFLLGAYEKEPGDFGPQTLYFLACLAGGAGSPNAALGWLRTAIEKNGWWYRPEVLVDDDLAQLEGSPEFIALKARSDARYQEAVSAAKSVFSWNGKTADYLFLAVHGNTQNAQTARVDWAPILAGDDRWQLETIQSAEPDGYGTFRWSYDDVSFLPVANHAGRGLRKNRVRRLFGRVRYAAARYCVYPGALRSSDSPKPVDSGLAGAQGGHFAGASAKGHCASDLLRRRR